MNNDLKKYLENAREDFLEYIEIMKPSLSSKDRVCMENIILAYDQAYETLNQYQTPCIEQLKCAWCSSIVLHCHTNLCKSCFEKGCAEF